MTSLLVKRPLGNVGDKFERWTVLGHPFRGPWGQQYVVCQCDCGTVKVCTVNNLKIKQTQSCGCLRNDLSRAVIVTHGLSKHSLYGVWSTMKKRCMTPTCKRFKDYGGRGITVCSEWLHDFPAFHAWATTHGWAPGLEIDREDNDRGYEPENCRFVTPKVNSNNRRVPAKNR